MNLVLQSSQASFVGAAGSPEPLSDIFWQIVYAPDRFHLRFAAVIFRGYSWLPDSCYVIDDASWPRLSSNFVVFGRTDLSKPLYCSRLCLLKSSAPVGLVVESICAALLYVAVGLADHELIECRQIFLFAAIRHVPVRQSFRRDIFDIFDVISEIFADRGEGLAYPIEAVIQEEPEIVVIAIRLQACMPSSLFKHVARDGPCSDRICEPHQLPYVAAIYAAPSIREVVEIDFAMCDPDVLSSRNG